MEKIQVTHYSDILCVWAYLGQIRVEELINNFGKQVSVDYCLFPVFGATHAKIKTMWGERGGIKAYQHHVLEISKQFKHVPIHEDVWVKSTPHSSLPGHLYLSAIKFLEQENRVPENSFPKLAKEIRHAFFAETKDVSNLEVLSNLVTQAELPLNEVQQAINSGQAFATLSMDMHSARNLSIRSSPTMLFNDDRQRLAGNVGYRIIEANIRELLEKPESQQTWC